MAPNTDIATRATVVALKAIAGKTSTDIACLLGLSARGVNKIYAKAIERGFDPNVLPVVIKDEYLADAPRSGRPTKQTEDVKDLIQSKVRRDRYGREKSCADIAGELSDAGINISAITIWRCLRALGFKKTKPTRKPGLTKKMREARLAWCLLHKDWTLADWMLVIWTDETSVVLNHRRGSYRIWRTSEEALVKSCIRERWKGYSEFMFWGCFSYYKKGPCHSYIPETAAEKKKAQKVIEKMNEELEPILREEWELSNGMRRLKINPSVGRKPKWKFNQKNGKLERSKKGGIDWYRYQTQVVIPKIIPFAKDLEKHHSKKAIVQEDGAAPHAHSAQQRVYNLYDVCRLLWPGNSPDLNAIEPCWFWMKRETTKKGAPKSRAEAIRRWKECWETNLDQARIQAWIERIPIHIQKIIELEGGNEYQEGKAHLRRAH